jgi:hypothetical protein
MASAKPVQVNMERRTMRFLVILIALWSLANGIVLAQDPGAPDSIIIGDVVSNLGDTLVEVPIYAVTDDSVAYFNLPLTIGAPEGGFTIDMVYVVPDPPHLVLWDEIYYDFVEEDGFLRLFGFWDTGGEDNPPLITGHERAHIMNLVFRIEPNTPDQYVTIEAFVDPVGGSLRFGLPDGLTSFEPAFVSGTITYGDPTGIEGVTEAIPARFALKQNYPNPFNPETIIEFALPVGQTVTLEICNILGQRVRTLITGFREAGTHTVAWNGTDDRNADVPSGVYFYRLNTGIFARTNKMTLIR